MTEPYTVLAFDPGGRTGWAVWSSLGDPDHIEVGEYDCLGVNDGDYSGLYRIHQRIEGGLLRPEFRIVCESFSIDPEDNRSAIDLTAVQVIGVIKLAVAYSNRLVFQPREIGRKFWTDDKLKQLSLYDLVKGKKDQKSALRHLLYYVTFTLGDPVFLHKLARI